VRRLIGWAAVGIGAIVLAGCPAARAPAPVEPPQGRARGLDVQTEVEPAPRRAWRPAQGGRLNHTAADLVFDLPSGWLVRPGEGEWSWEVQGPRWPATVLRIGAWNGSIEGLIDRYEAADQAWLSSGPYSNLEAICEGPTVVGTRQAQDDVLVVGWYFRVDGVGVAMEAELPARLFEESWRDVDLVVRSVRRRSE
jgi:hypothetical protein